MMAIRRFLGRIFPKAGYGSLPSPAGDKSGSIPALTAESPRSMLVDQVWSGFSNEGEEYLVLRLAKSRDPRPSCTQKIRSLPNDRSYRLLAAAKISVTLDFSSILYGEIVSFRDDGVH